MPTDVEAKLVAKERNVLLQIADDQGGPATLELDLLRHGDDRSSRRSQRNSSASAAAAGGHGPGEAYTLPPSAAAAGSAGRASRNLAPNSTAANLVANVTTTKTPSASDRPAARRMSRSIT